jgi:hypothetical protein
MERSITLVASVALLVCLITSFSSGADRKFEKKFAVSPGGTLTLSTDVGDVDFAGTSSDEVSIVAELRGRQRDIDEFDISAWQNDKGVEVKGKSKGSHWFSWFHDDMEVRYIVKLPREYNVQVNTSGGDITIVGLKGRMQGETSGGDLRLNDIEGAVKLETSGGDIRTEKVVGDIQMETSGGDIQLLAVTGNIDVSTSGGDIRISDVSGKVRAETSGGDVVVKAKGDNKGIQAETSGGDIDIFLPESITANIDASTSGGEVICDLPVTMSGKIDESRVRGTVNGGGAPIRAHTSGGDVRIKVAE